MAETGNDIRANPEAALLTLQNVTKLRAGTKILDHISLTIRENRIIGVAGGNGAGKTTLLKLMAGLLIPDSGQIVRASGSFSSLLSGLHFYNWMTIEDCVKFYNDFYNDFDRARALPLLDSLNTVRNTRVCRLSRGQQERLCMILALCRSCGLYLFDEPFDGVDPFFKKDMKRFLLEHMAEGSSVVMVTHLLKDFETLFDEVIFVEQGHVWQLETEEIRSRYHKSVEQYYLEEVNHE